MCSEWKKRNLNQVDPIECMAKTPKKSFRNCCHSVCLSFFIMKWAHLWMCVVKSSQVKSKKQPRPSSTLSKNTCYIMVIFNILFFGPWDTCALRAEDILCHLQISDLDAWLCTNSDLKCEKTNIFSYDICIKSQFLDCGRNWLLFYI